MIDLSDSQRLFVRPEYEILPIDGTSVLVRSPDTGVRVRATDLPADELAALLRSLDGSITVGALRARSESLGRVLGELLARDVVRLVASNARSASERCFERTHHDARECRARLAASRVGVCGAASFAALVRRDLADIGVQPGDWQAHGLDLIVACLGSPRDALARSVHAGARARRAAWLPLLVFGDAGFVGPLFVPDEGPCWECLQSREVANWADPTLTDRYYEAIARTGRSVAAFGSLPAYGALVSHWGVLEATKYLTRFRIPSLLGAVLRIDFARTQAQIHRVLTVPRCRGCSRVVQRPPVDGSLFADR